MPLLGKGVAAIWHNVAPELRADYNAWHVHEHVPERVGVPGFLRGRRYVAVEGAPEFFHFYETETPETLVSRPYLERLNDPTPWTRRVGPSLRDNNRSLCAVAASFGVGGGAAILTARLGADAGGTEALAAWLAGEALPGLPGDAGIVGAHLLRGDREASAVQTEEKAMRGRPDEVAGLVVFVEGIEAGALDPLWKGAGPLSEAAFRARGAAEAAVGTYRLHYALSAEELG